MTLLEWTFAGVKVRVQSCLRLEVCSTVAQVVSAILTAHLALLVSQNLVDVVAFIATVMFACVLLVDSSHKGSRTWPTAILPTSWIRLFG